MKHEVSRLVEQALLGLLPFLALRGADSMSREGGDLDFIVPPHQALTACRLVADAAILKGWFLGGFCHIGYLAQIILIRPGSVEADDAVKIDFFDGLRWYGVGRDIGGYRLFRELLPAPGDQLKLAGAVGFFQKLLFVGQCNARDWSRVVASGANMPYLAECAAVLGLPLQPEQIQAHGVRGLAKWRLRAASGGAVGLGRGLVWFFSCAFAHLRFKLTAGSGMGLVLGLSGLDGSGKSTLLGRLISAYQKAGGKQPELVHLLPRWIPLPHQIVRRVKTKTNYTRPYAEPAVTSTLSAAMRLGYYFFAFSIARISLWWAAKRGQLIFLDRSFLDFASDLPRARIPARRLPVGLMRALSPKGRLFFLNAAPEVVVARKGELTLEKARSLQTSYLATSDVLRATLLGGDDAPDAVFSELLGHISSIYRSRIEVAEARK